MKDPKEEGTDFEQGLLHRIEQLESQLEAKRTIAKAKGILMERGLSEDEAYARLRKASMDTRTPLVEVAKAVVLAASLQ